MYVLTYVYVNYVTQISMWDQFQQIQNIKTLILTNFNPEICTNSKIVSLNKYLNAKHWYFWYSAFAKIFSLKIWMGKFSLISTL